MCVIPSSHTRFELFVGCTQYDIDLTQLVFDGLCPLGRDNPIAVNITVQPVSLDSWPISGSPIIRPYQGFDIICHFTHNFQQTQTCNLLLIPWMSTNMFNCNVPTSKIFIFYDLSECCNSSNASPTPPCSLRCEVG